MKKDFNMLQKVAMIFIMEDSLTPIEFHFINSIE